MSPTHHPDPKRWTENRILLDNGFMYLILLVELTKRKSKAAGHSKGMKFSTLLFRYMYIKKQKGFTI
jgi:tRNA A22 N-methylase